MIVSILTFALVAAITFTFLAVTFHIWRRFPKRSADDLIPFLQAISLEEVFKLFDPRGEARLRSELSEKDFRVLQRKRLYLADEYLQRMAHNAAVLAEWANAELYREHPLTQELASELHQRALNVRVYAFFTRFKLNLWLILRLESARLLPAAHVADFRECAGIEGLHAYDNLKTAAGSLFAFRTHRVRALDAQSLAKFSADASSGPGPLPFTFLSRTFYLFLPPGGILLRAGRLPS